MDMRTIMKLLAERRRPRKQERWTRPQLDAYRERSLRLLRDYVYAHSPFYREFHKGLHSAPLQELPVLTKAMVMERFDDLVTDRAIRLRDVQAHMAGGKGEERFRGRYLVTSTSGSSGRPGLFLADRDEWIATLAAALRIFEWAGVELRLGHRVRMAQITSTSPFHMSAQGGKTMGNRWMPMLLLSAGEPVAGLVERLNAWRPEILIAYASMIRILAEEQLAGRLGIAPCSVLSGSEVPTQETRRRAVQAWGKVVFNEYGTTDCGGIAAECDRHTGMHLQEDLAIVEVVDRQNRPVSAGVYGDKLLVTVLGNFTQPLIRYELDDSVRLSALERCPCGRPSGLIDGIQGRVHEIPSFPGAAGGTVNVHPIVFHEIADALPVSGWQVVQEVEGLRILLSGVHGALDKEALADAVRRALARQGAAVPRVEVMEVASIPQTMSGKTPLVKSNLASDPPPIVDLPVT
ncbi:MAG: phenylacetate--CoA ligase family protein [Rectinemataceae bacterium]